MNRRPLLPAAAALAAGIALGRALPLSIPYIAAAAGFAAAALFVWLRRRRTGRGRSAIVALGCAALGLFGAFLTANIMQTPAVPTGRALSVSGRVYGEPYVNDYGSTVVLLTDARVEGTSCGGVKLYVSGAPALRCGDAVEAEAKVELPKGVRNPGGFDERLYLLSQGVYAKAYADEAVVTGWGGGWHVWMAAARAKLSGIVDDVFEPEVAPVAKAMLLGDTMGIDEATHTAFKDTGMAHVLAVSGLNAAILVAFVYYALKLLRMGRTPRLAVTLAFIAAYACVTGLTPSVVRAALMAWTVLIGKYLGRQADTLNCLALSFIAALLWRPLDLFAAGFQLSYAAVLGMLTLGAQVNRWLRPKLPGRLHWAGNTLSASVGASAGTAPVLAATFHRVSTLGILLNIAVIPLASAATVIVFIAVLAGAFWAQAAVYVGYVAASMIRLMLWLIHAASGVSFIAMDVAAPPAWLVLAIIAALLLASRYVLLATRVKAIACAALAGVAIAASLLSAPSGMYLVFLDVGQGDASYIRTAQGGGYFIDGGPERSAQEVVDFAVRRGARVGAAFASHTDADHFAGLCALYDAGLLRKVYCSYQEADAVRAAMPEAEVVPLSAGDTVLLDDETRAVVLYPYRDAAPEETNELSLVLLVEYGGHTMLFTGDAPGAVETELFMSLGEVDIYKAAHHGSKHSSYRLPLSALSPEYSVVSVGGNTYGHPDPLAMDNLRDYSDEVFVTQEDYAVEFHIGADIRVHTYGGRY